MSPPSAPGFGVYVHWPYCAAICPYCDFNVYRARGSDPAALISAIATDLAGHAARFKLPPAETVFLGGGTPSLLSGAQIAALIGAVAQTIGLAPGAEITLEANPEDAARFADHAAAGVNRFSIGVQALRDPDLKVLGRAHGAAEARAAVATAAALGARVSADFIYARHGQSLADWRAELGQALALPVEHLSLYQLTIEDGTAYQRFVRRGRIVPPEPGLAADFYALTQDLCAAAGYAAYEVSNHARTPAARSRHNLLYWTGGQFVGVGPGAHGRLRAADGAMSATYAHARPDAYAAALGAQGVGWAENTGLSPEEIGDERLLMGLRLQEGVGMADVAAAWGRPLDQHALAGLQAEGLIALEAGRVRLTDAGRLVADRVALALAATP